ncbi:MAG: hypothetical protein PHO91_01805 [Patescibacteria group bacterium]|nr:hypothetical protein [Patescibacteria group bacterium]
MKKIKKAQGALLLLYVFLACLLVYFIKPLYFYSILIVLLPPATINFIWLKNKNSRRNILIFSLLSALFFAPPVELVSRLANVWDVQSIFYRPFGYIPLENMLFAFLNFFWVLSFYKYFIKRDENKNAKISPRFKYLLLLYGLLNILVYSFYFYDKNLVSFNYWLMAIIVLFIPFVLIFSWRPKLLKKTIIPTIFFALVFFVYEIVSLLIGSWWWPGDYLWPITIAGHIFPLDDVLIWYFLSTPVLIGAYEVFVDEG